MSGGRRSKAPKTKSRVRAHRGQSAKAVKKRRVRSRMTRESRRRNLSVDDIRQLLPKVATRG